MHRLTASARQLLPILAAASVSCHVAGTTPRAPEVRHLPSPLHKVQAASYVAAYNSAARCPLWVYERITAEHRQGSASRQSVTFRPERTIPARFAAPVTATTGTPYDRGHMAPAANSKWSQAAMEETFSMANIVPQVGVGMNRDYWARLEAFTSRLAKPGTTVHIMSGPLWLPQPVAPAHGRRASSDDSALGASKPGAAGLDPFVLPTALPTAPGSVAWEMRYPVLGTPPQAVSVPTHCFKVVVVESKQLAPANTGQAPSTSNAIIEASSAAPRFAVAAFVVPNAPVPAGWPLEQCLVPLGVLEDALGFELFPQLIKQNDVRAIDSAFTAAPWVTQALPSLGLAPTPGANTPSNVQLPPPGHPLHAGARAWRFTRRPVAGTSHIGTPVYHLCHVKQCTLPPPDWFKPGQGK